MRTDPLPDQTITLTRRCLQAFPIEYCDLSSTALNQTGSFKLMDSVRDGRPLDAQHFGKQALSDLQRIIVAAVAHHEKPTREPLSEAVCAITSDTATMPAYPHIQLIRGTPNSQSECDACGRAYQSWWDTFISSPSLSVGRARQRRQRGQGRESYSL
jgi:hypothetical protein